MSLHDQYQELLRRGMPEHPNLTFDKRGSNGMVPYLGCNLTHDYIARDLIEAHALRWFMANDWNNTMLDAILAATEGRKP